MIRKISFKNFKIFKQEQTLELRPITILIGKNNTGKSAILRLPTMIAGSLSGKFSSPINLNNENVRIGYSNEDLFYNKEITNDPLVFNIESSTGNQLEVFISGDRRYNINISRYTLDNTSIDVKKNKFNGFLSAGIPLDASMNLNFDYIDSFRKFPDAQFSDIYEEYKKIGITGENAYKAIAQYHKNDNPILTQLKNWFKANFEGWEIGVKDIAGSSSLYEIVLSTPKLKEINIVNTGSGIRQSLPLIVRSFMPVEEETLIIIEEPETHLHPAAHGNLAQRFVESYLEDNKRRYLIETHSQNFVLRLRALVAAKKIKVSDLAIYYVDFNEETNSSNLQEINVDIDGEVEWWPKGVFNESLDEVINLRKAQDSK